MGKTLRDRYLRSLDLLPLREIADGTGRSYYTIRAYKYGQRAITPAAARELARYLRQRAQKFHKAADRLEAAADSEEGNG